MHTHNPYTHTRAFLTKTDMADLKYDIKQETKDIATQTNEFTIADDVNVHNNNNPNKLTNYTLNINDSEFATRLLNIYKEYGFAIISDVYTKDECRGWIEDIIGYFESLGTGVDRQNILKTWKESNLPPQTRPGLFQALCSNLSSTWQVRSHPGTRKIFESIYSGLRGCQIKDFIVSGDGINVYPNDLVAQEDKSKVINQHDWPHVDQTLRDNLYKCVQGQAVLSNTTAGFRVSPKSHLVFEQLLDLEGVGHSNKSNWCRINNVTTAKSLVEAKEGGGKWQIPIIVPAGSFIIWSSTCVHSAILPTRKELKAPLEDPYLGWRVVVYVCYRPTEEFKPTEIKNRQQSFEENLTTNHWGTRRFDKMPKFKHVSYHPELLKLINDPKLAYKIKPIILTEQQRRLLGYPPTLFKGFVLKSKSKLNSMYDLASDFGSGNVKTEKS